MYRFYRGDIVQSLSPRYIDRSLPPLDIHTPCNYTNDTKLAFLGVICFSSCSLVHSGGHAQK